MSERVEKLIAHENAEILRMLTEDEAIFVRAYFYVDNDGKRVYDTDLIKQEFEENDYILQDTPKTKVGATIIIVAVIICIIAIILSGIYFELW